MAGRGGRGAALMEALLARQRQPGSDEQEEQSTPEQPPPATAAAGGRGRAALFATLAKQRTQAQEPPGAQAQEPPPPPAAVAEQPTVARGRAQLFQALARGRGMPESVGAAASRSPESVKSSSSRDTEAVTKRISQVSLQENPPVHRTGESGKTIKATANYVRLFLEPGKGVYEYEVRFIPNIDSQSIRFKLLNQHHRALGGAKTFDGTILYLPIQLPNQETLFTSKHPSDDSDYTVKVIFKRKKRLGECKQLYNVLFRRIMNELELVLIGRQHFCPKSAHPIPQHRLEVWPGFVTAVDEYEGGIQLCCDASHRVLRTQTVLEVLQDIVNRNPADYRDMAQKLLIGCCVLTRYNNRTYRVDDINWDDSPLSTFDTSTGEKISFQQYYKKHYDINIRDLKQPLLISRVKRKVKGKEEDNGMLCLVPEICFMTGLTDDMRSDFHVMKDISMYTRITPNQRQAAIKKFINNIESCGKAKELLAGWGLSLDKSTVPLMCRTLDPENVYFGNNAMQRGGPQADWGAASTRNNVLTAVDLQQWILVHSQRDTRCANEFRGMMQKVGPQMGIQVCDAKIIGLRDDRTDSYLRALRENITPSTQVAVIIFPTSRDDRYSAVKKLCCAEMPVASQVIISRTLARPDRVRSVVQKIALQINCKLGGTLWAVKIPLENCMVCGIDSYHDSASKGNSVAAFVASLNQSLTRWFSRVCIQGQQQELVDGLKTCFIAALTAYYNENHKFPDRIVIYRDGVGDGQLNVSNEYEVPQFESCFRNISPNYEPKLTVVICQKRINTRIFADLKGGGEGGLENPPPGSVMDHTITRRNHYDFFLVSQHVRQGTVTPTHYVVIHDSCNMKTDHLQRLTYKLCHLYYNWPGTIRVPAPCQYAHKLAQLVGQNIHKQPSERLSQRLYFL